jgi:hypothetical protein
MIARVLPIAQDALAGHGNGYVADLQQTVGPFTHRKRPHHDVVQQVLTIFAV